MEMEELKKQGNASDHLANERTFLAWIRTSIGIMAFGFVVVKFSLFVKQVSTLVGKPGLVQHRSYSVIVGIILVAAGTLTCVLSYFRYKRTEKILKQGNYKNNSFLIAITTAIIFLISILLIAYLIEST
jgi:putative membrane protein